MMAHTTLTGEGHWEVEPSMPPDPLKPLRTTDFAMTAQGALNSVSCLPLFLLTAHRDKKAALRFLKKAIRPHGLPDKVTIDKSGANTAAIEALKENTGHAIEIRQNQYINNLVEQDHRAVQRIVRPMLGFKGCHSARTTLRGIERLHRIKKGQMIMAKGTHRSAAGPFYSLAA
jgi:transposase-like protein